MQENSENMVQDLLQILQLNPDHPPDPLLADLEADDHLKDHKILEYATQHNHPVFVGIDDSLDNNGIAITTISIIALDIQDEDYQETEWHHRLGKVLLIRSWHLPKEWGTGKADINMAEAVGFIIGAYTIPCDIPIIFVTDSNNARTF
jgi:hypothetical protein